MLPLHVVIVAALLRAVVSEPSSPPRQTETTMVLLPVPEQPQKAAQVKAHGGAGPGAINTPVPVFQTPDFSQQALGIGEALFGCRPENLRELSREQQEKCLKLAGGRMVAMKDGLPIYIKPPGPEWEGLRNSDLRARERNTSDPCQAAKATGTECIHEVIYGKGLW